MAYHKLLDTITDARKMHAIASPEVNTAIRNHIAWMPDHTAQTDIANIKVHLFLTCADCGDPFDSPQRGMPYTMRDGSRICGMCWDHLQDATGI